MINEQSSRRLYKDLFEAGEVILEPDDLSSQVSEPAAVNSTDNNKRETFDRAGDEVDDVLHQQKLIHLADRVVDDITKRLGASIYWSDARFAWALSLSGYKMRFSRRYATPCVLVDIFNNDTPAVREEVSRKRAAIALHNAAIDQAMKERVDDYREHYAYFLSKGEVSFGYLPLLLGRFAEAAFVEAVAGKVTNLPARRVIPMNDAQGMGMRSLV